MNETNLIQVSNDAIYTISSKFETFLGRIEFLFQENNKVSWYNEGWVIALISSFSTALLFVFIEYLRYLYKQRQLKKKIATDLFFEITTILLKINKFKDKNYNLVQDFKQKAINNDFSEGHPSLIGISDGNDDFYKIHLSNLSLLQENKKDFLVLGIKIFYDSVLDYNENSKIIGDLFKKYYAENSTIGHMDIVEREDGQYKDAGLIILRGYDILGNLQARFKVDNSKLSRKEKKENIKKIFGLDKDIITNIQEEAKQLKVNEVYFIMMIDKYKLYKNTDKTGEYKKTEDSFLRKVRRAIICIC